MPYSPITQLPDPPQRGDDPAQFTADYNALFAAQQAFVTEVNAAGQYVETTAGEVDDDATAAAASAELSEDWATTTGALVESTDYAAKEWAQGTTAESAKRWATDTGATVDGSDYAAKEYASGIFVPTGSSKEWATVTGTQVDGDYAAKEWAQGTTAESAKRWATDTAEVSGGLKGARGYADDASGAASLAQSTANFKGNWSDLTGSLSVPASVYHDSRHWNLLNNLADVTTSEPGVSADWAVVNLAEVWEYINSSQTLEASHNYEVDFTTGPLTLTLPAGPIINDFIQFYKGAGQSSGSVIARNGETIMGLDEDLTINYETTSLHLVYNGSDWRIVR